MRTDASFYKIQYNFARSNGKRRSTSLCRRRIQPGAAPGSARRCVEKKGKRAYKPGSVSGNRQSRMLGMAIHLGRRLPVASSNLPGDRTERIAPRRIKLTLDDRTCVRFSRDHPIWSCTEWGLPCHRHHWRCGELLPRHFTLTGDWPCGQSLGFCFRKTPAQSYP